jgi:hypothetical protein
MTLDPCKEANLDNSDFKNLEENISDFECVNSLPLSIADLKQVQVTFNACEGKDQPFLCRSKDEIL